MIILARVMPPLVPAISQPSRYFNERSVMEAISVLTFEERVALQIDYI
ncbi:hypothetical protein [[Eubacterium] cellulosolvens]